MGAVLLDADPYSQKPRPRSAVLCDPVADYRIIGPRGYDHPIVDVPMGVVLQDVTERRVPEEEPLPISGKLVLRDGAAGGVLQKYSGPGVLADSVPLDGDPFRALDPDPVFVALKKGRSLDGGHLTVLKP